MSSRYWAACAVILLSVVFNLTVENRSAYIGDFLRFNSNFKPFLFLNSWLSACFISPSKNIRVPSPHLAINSFKWSSVKF